MNETQQSGHLLVIDDDVVLRTVAVESLRHAGFKVSDVGSGEDALRQFESGSYDLILLDVMMPGLSGYEVCQRIRATAKGAQIPILMLTGLDDTASIELAYHSGATDFISKPFNGALLSKRVQYALRTSNITKAMKHSRESLASAQRLAGMGSWEMFPDGSMQWSEQLVVLLGAPVDAAQQATTESFLARVAEPDRDDVHQARRRLVADGTPYQMEFRIVRDDGAVRTVFEQASPISGEDAQALGFEGITQDITDRIQAEEKIRHLANYDPVTGLPNRQFFAELALTPIESARRQGSTCALLHIDVDHFTAVNDAFGRARGDVVLGTLAERLRLWTRRSDLTAVGQLHGESNLLARVGSNAFTFLCNDLDGQTQATLVAQRLFQVVAEPIEMESQALVLTASIGIAMFPSDANDLITLARCAEQAVYAAKKGGRAQYRFYDEQMNVQATNRLLMETALRRAISKGELRLHFQPKVDASNGTIVGAEALVRWQHPERGLLQPMEFIAIAEECGLILPLTDWVLERACQSLHNWSQAGLPSLPLSVNLAAPSMMDATLIEKLDDLIGRFSLTPASLTLEITETMLMHNVQASTALLHKLRAKGYGLSLDDFGTGYSSLSYLQRFPVHELKIDRSFVTDSAQGGQDATLVVAIIRLSREFGLHVVAEGVETQAQSAFLLKHGALIQQGYLFSRPVAPAAFEDLLRNSQSAQQIPPEK